MDVLEVGRLVLLLVIIGRANAEPANAATRKETEACILIDE